MEKGDAPSYTPRFTANYGGPTPVVLTLLYLFLENFWLSGSFALLGFGVG